MFGTTSQPTTRERPSVWISFSVMRPPGLPITRSWGGREKFKEPASWCRMKAIASCTKSAANPCGCWPWSTLRASGHWSVIERCEWERSGR